MTVKDPFLLSLSLRVLGSILQQVSCFWGCTGHFCLVESNKPDSKYNPGSERLMHLPSAVGMLLGMLIRD